MDTLKLKMEIADRKFEAEGPAELVETNFTRFLRITVPGWTDAQPETAPIQSIMALQGKTVYLKVRTRHVWQTIVLLLLGHRELRRNFNVPGTEILSGLRASGLQQNRADRILRTLIGWKYVQGRGQRRGRHYELTDTGVELARKFVKELSVSPGKPPAAAAQTTTS